MAAARLNGVSRRGLLAALAAGALFAASPAAGEAAADARPVAVDGAVEYSISSDAGGDYRILVWQPSGPVPGNGFPVLYAFDGDETFGMAVDLARSLAPAARRAGLRPAMVVAIGYPRGEGGPDRRTYDLTPASDTHAMPERPNGQPWPQLGGGDALLAMIAGKVKPLVAARHPADGAAETLFGHSLGGLMALYAFANRPSGFEDFVASSPSIWVDDRRILADLERALARGTSARLRVTVGSREETLSAWDRRSDIDIEARERWVKGNRMVGNARDLAALFEARAADFGFDVLDGHDHRSAIPVALQRALMLTIEGR